MTGVSSAAPPAPLGVDARVARWSAAALAVAGGLLHLGQVRVHFDEDWTFGTFFIVVGVLQLLGGLYVARPLGPRRLVRSVFEFGVIGSLATITIWFVSRAFGLPFGAEPGERESVGLADAAAGLFELVTSLLLLIWLRREDGRGVTTYAVAGSAASILLAAIWTLTRTAGLFNTDTRLIIAPDQVDVAAVGFLLLAAVLFAGLPSDRFDPAHRRGIAAASVLVPLLAASIALTAFTLPARGGQNRDCAYGPIADDSGLAHATAPEAIVLLPGERRSAVILILVACAGRPVELLDVRPYVPLEPTAPIAIARYTIEPGRAARSAWVAERGSANDARGVVLLPGQRYPLAVEVIGVADGRQALAAFRIDYRDGSERGTISFASVVRFAVGHDPRE